MALEVALPKATPKGAHQGQSTLAGQGADRVDDGDVWKVTPSSVFPIRPPADAWLSHDDFETIFSPETQRELCVKIKERRCEMYKQNLIRWHFVSGQTFHAAFVDRL